MNAGHMAPLLRQRRRGVEEIGEDAAGLPLGVADGLSSTKPYTHSLEPGDLLTIFTDGFSEAMNAERELYGLERLKEQISSPAVSVADFGQHILDDVAQVRRRLRPERRHVPGLLRAEWRSRAVSR